jgi:alpha-L-arabinofuranosidase
MLTPKSRLYALIVIVLIPITACVAGSTGSSGTPTTSPEPPTAPSEPRATPTRTRRPTRTPTPTPTATPERIVATIEVDAAAEGMSFSSLMLGSNLPSWLGRSTFEDEQFRRRVAASGVTLLRIPGGAWGDEYGWLSCETGKDQPGAFPCWHEWQATPSDFINFFRGVEALGVHIEPMYIMNMNYTAQEAAATVAFYNAPITDTTPIGMDRNGTGWRTVGHWARLRADHGNETPLGIHYWEIGNEVYGGKPGDLGCKSNGWEETWTCRGDEYMIGTDEHDGALDLRAAMLAVDPTIAVGMVGASGAAFGNRWSEAVLTSGGDEIDYFVIHTYPNYHNYGNPRKELDELVALPQTHWKRLKESADKALHTYAEGLEIPLVVNEYEMVPEWGRPDIRNYMNKYVDAIFITDSIGQMIVHGFDIAAQWDVMNGKSDDWGNEFGLMKADGSNDRQPKYWAFPLWARFGTAMLHVVSSAKAESELSVYGGRREDGTITLLVINKSDRFADVEVTLAGVGRIVGGLADVVAAPSLDSTTATFNGIEDPADDLSDAPPLPVDAGQYNRLNHTFAPFSITLLRLEVAASTP